MIPDIDEAVGGRRCISTSAAAASRLLACVPDLPLLVWGRDEAHVHDMWNSNSLIAWLLTRTGLDARRVEPPLAGRTPGWRAGIEVAQRQTR